MPGGSPTFNLDDASRNQFARFFAIRAVDVNAETGNGLNFANLRCRWKRSPEWFIRRLYC
jgi:hypothetical protein